MTHLKAAMLHNLASPILATVSASTSTRHGRTEPAGLPALPVVRLGVVPSNNSRAPLAQCSRLVADYQSNPALGSASLLLSLNRQGSPVRGSNSQWELLQLNSF